MRSETGDGSLPDVSWERISGQCDHRRVEASLQKLSNKVVSIHAGHRDIAHYKIETFDREDFDGIFGARGDFHNRAGVLENLPEHKQCIPVIIHNQHANPAEIELARI